MGAKMSFRENLQALRSSKNMTQEQLAVLLGVSRQSVAKWEAEKSTPELEKLNAIAKIFGVSLDELINGEISFTKTGVNKTDKTQRAQDVIGYDAFRKKHSVRISLGIALIIFGVFFSGTVSELSSYNIGLSKDMIDIMSGLVMSLFIILGLVSLIPSGLKFSEFRKAHPYVENFYNKSDYTHVRKLFFASLIVGISLLFISLMLMLAFTDAYPAESLAAFAVLVACGVGLITYGVMRLSALDIDEYNIQSEMKMSFSEIDELDNEAHKKELKLIKIVDIVQDILSVLVIFGGIAISMIQFFSGNSYFWIPLLAIIAIYLLILIIGGLIISGVKRYN